MPPGSAVSIWAEGGRRSGCLPFRSPGPGRHGRLCHPPPACFLWPSGFPSPACQAQAPQVTPRAFPCRPDFSAPPALPAALMSVDTQAKRVTAASG